MQLQQPLPAGGGVGVGVNAMQAAPGTICPTTVAASHCAFCTGAQAPQSPGDSWYTQALPQLQHHITTVGVGVGTEGCGVSMTTWICQTSSAEVGVTVGVLGGVPVGGGVGVNVLHAAT